jgi:sugar/nucleoside kinase (ribokinase family)
VFDVITIGGASRDIFFMTDEGKILHDPRLHTRMLSFEFGSKIIPEESVFTYGGGGANTAVNFAKAGLRTSTIMNIGAEGTGSLIVKDLQKDGVDCTHITRDRVNHTALSIILSYPGKDHTMFLYRGSNNFLKIHDWRQIRTKWFYVASLTGESADLLPEIFSFARAHSIKIAWNPGHDQLILGKKDLATYLATTDILILNKSEAKTLLGLSKSKKDIDIETLIKKVQALTDWTVVITDGEKGSYVFDGEDFYHEPARSTTVVETTGAGDSYGSTFTAAKILGYGTKYAMKLASAQSASVVKYIGAQEGLMTFDKLRDTIDKEGIDEKS